MGEFEMLNSCGDTQKLKIIRNGDSCDNTSNKLQCGRILAHTVISESIGDWSYAHVGQNIGQKRWIALKSRMNVRAEAESTVGSESAVIDYSKFLIVAASLGAFGLGYYYAMQKQDTKYHPLMEME